MAIVFLHSYANPEHELQALSDLREAGFEGDVSLSHAASGEYREYERTCTTVIDAYVRREVSTYLRRLDDGLAAAGFDGLKLITRSGGGAMTFAEAQARPFETILSGPVAGAEGASLLASELKLDAVVTADVGGTSFDTCADRGRPATQAVRGRGGRAPGSGPVDRRPLDRRRRRLDRLRRHRRPAAGWAAERRGRAGPGLLRALAAARPP